MLHMYGGDQENGESLTRSPAPSCLSRPNRLVRAGVNDHRDSDGGGRGRLKLSPPLQIPKNRSTGNLASAEGIDRSRIRFSLDAGAAAAEYDALARSVSALVIRSGPSHGPPPDSTTPACARGLPVC